MRTIRIVVGPENWSTRKCAAAECRDNFGMWGGYLESPNPHPLGSNVSLGYAVARETLFRVADFERKRKSPAYSAEHYCNNIFAGFRLQFLVEIEPSIEKRN